MEAEQLVQRHVLACQSTVVEELIRSDRTMANCPFTSDEEVLEWWLVTPYLAQKLQQEGEIIVQEYGNSWWGRTTSGQAIRMDGVIRTICED